MELEQQLTMKFQSGKPLNFISSDPKSTCGKGKTTLYGWQWKHAPAISCPRLMSRETHHIPNPCFPGTQCCLLWLGPRFSSSVFWLGWRSLDFTTLIPGLLGIFGSPPPFVCLFVFTAYKGISKELKDDSLHSVSKPIAFMKKFKWARSAV